MPRQVGLLVLLLLLVVPCVLAADANLTRLSLVDFVATGAVDGTAVELLLDDEGPSYACTTRPEAKLNVCFPEAACLSVQNRQCSPPGRLAIADVRTLSTWPQMAVSSNILYFAVDMASFERVVLVQPPSLFLLHNLTLCDTVPVTRVSNSYVARVSFNEPCWALPRALHDELFPAGTAQSTGLPSPVSFALAASGGATVRGLSLGCEGVRVAPDDVAVIGRAGLGRMVAVYTGNVLSGFILLANAVDSSHAPCPTCPALSVFDLGSRSCVDLCSSYFFMAADPATGTCKTRLTAAVLMGVTVLALVGGEAVLFVVNKLVWRVAPHHPPAAAAAVA